MATEYSNDIGRPAGDTYPSKSVIDINGVPVDLTEWDVDLRYKKTEGEVTTEWVINCVITDAKTGKINIYPHGRTRADADAAGTRLLPADYVMTGEVGANQVWDEDEANAVYPFYIVRLRTYDDGYVEEMTHNSGVAVLNPRYVS